MTAAEPRYGTGYRKDGTRKLKPGRKPSGLAGPAHVARPEHRRAHAVLVKFHGLEGLPSFRVRANLAAFERAVRDTKRPGFRIVAYAVERDTVHLIVEADDGPTLSRGMSAFSVRANRLYNAATGRGRGQVWRGRHDRTELATASLVGEALATCARRALSSPARTTLLKRALG